MSNIAFTRIQRECKEVVTNKEIAETGFSFSTTLWIHKMFRKLMPEIITLKLFIPLNH
uniref:HTH_48 domain-containing protein n=1 Tax=Heterorhabditis bacteriophora TaxID=37862 RepID=A0A1I7WQV2_HETBA